MDSDSSHDLFASLAEEFLARARRGESPTIEEYAVRFPDLAERVRSLFPTLMVIEDIAEDTVEPAPRSVPDAAVDLIDGYSIIREIGRGGMGIVYEAEQMSLGRRVALKVLLDDISSHARSRERFQLEARLAASLEHPHIVPVHEVGENQDRCYYAMKLIRGLGLDVVQEEIRRRQSTILGSKGVAVGSGSQGSTPASDPSGAENQTNDVSTGVVANLDETVVELPTPIAAVDRLMDSGAISDVYKRRLDYFGNIARIGMHVAEALAYAHRQGVVHRDIKPSNLLVDEQGKVWITDFGLAKRGADGPTKTGTVVGTLRYMAPERFKGWSDPRSDIYSLGATLYELATLRPVFDCEDRVELIKEITTSEPRPPRSINQRIPKDLETIILKAVCNESAGRYQSAELMAEDLEAFVQDRPIRARRSNQIERAWRWCRRNVIVASLIAAFWCVLILGCTVSTLMWWRSQTKAELARDNYHMALRAVNNCFILFDEDSRLKEPELQPLRRELLQYCLDNYKSFTKNHSDDPKLIKDIIQSHRSIGHMYVDLGKPQSSEHEYHQALYLASKLPSDPEIQNLTAATLADLGSLFCNMGRSKVSLEHYDRALELSRQLDQNDINVRVIQAHILSGIGLLQTYLGNTDSAIENLDLARNEWTLVVQEQPSRYGINLAVAQTDISYPFFDKGKFDEAEAALRLAQEFFDHTDDQYTELRIELQFALARLYYDTGRLDQSATLLRSILSTCRKMVQTDPTSFRYRELLGRAHRMTALIHRGRLELTLADNQFKALRSLIKKNVKLDYLTHGHFITAHQIGIELNPSNDQFIDNFAHHLEIYEEELKSFGDYPEFELQMALGTAQLAMVSNDPEDQRAKMRESLEMITGLVNRFPELRRHRVVLSAWHNNFGNQLKRQGNLKGALEHYQEALKSIESVDPKILSFSDRLVYPRVLHNLSIAEYARGDNEKAKTIQAKAIELREELAAIAPEWTACRSDLAFSHYAMSRFVAASETTKHLELAIDLWEPLKDHSYDILVGLGGACCNLGHSTPEFSDALELFENGEEVLTKAVMTRPQDRQAQQFLWNTLLSKASRLIQNRGVEHEDQLEQAMESMLKLKNLGLLESKKRQSDVKLYLNSLKSHPRWDELFVPL